MNELKLLDCTLRDGGYVNDWQWGFKKARNIIKSLVKANIDIVEVGFLRNVDCYNSDVTACNYIEELNKLLPEKTNNTMFSAMAMQSNYDINKLSPYCGEGIEMIRITAHDYDIEEGMDFAKKVKEKGYKLSINPINIMGYTDKKIMWILEQVNKIQPYQFSIVDTFGSMKHKDLERIVLLVDNNLDRNIRVGLHLHENMAISCLLAQSFINKHLQRSITVDGSLMGMGRIPGNLPIELIADYINENAAGNYDIDYMMDAIQDYINPLKGNSEWGYTPAYFLSARFNLHRNYAEHYLKKGDINHRDINHILARFETSKKTAFDANYADSLYEEYKNNTIDDKKSFIQLKEQLKGKKILVVAPGSSIIEMKDTIESFIIQERPIVISINFILDNNWSNMAFFSNSKRFEQFSNQSTPTIITSNIKESKADYVINHNTLSSAVKLGTNSLVMLLKLLKSLEVSVIYVAGADGFKEGEMPYYNNVMSQYNENWNQHNLSVKEAITALSITPRFITPSAYEE